MKSIQSNNGLENENMFVHYFNRKRFSELDPISQDLIEFLYGNVNPDRIIACKLNLNKQKSDIILIVDGIKKYISIKKGYKNSVHTEYIFSFINFLKQNGMKPELIKKFLRFHYADGTINGSGMIRFSSEEYLLKYPKDIEEINEFFNNSELIKKSVARLVLYGNNSDIPIDAIIWGIPNDYLWITREEIINICLKHSGISKHGIAISGLFYQPFNRNLKFNPRYEYARKYVQFKWYHLSDDIIETMAFYRPKR